MSFEIKRGKPISPERLVVYLYDMGYSRNNISYIMDKGHSYVQKIIDLEGNKTLHKEGVSRLRERYKNLAKHALVKQKVKDAVVSGMKYKVNKKFSGAIKKSFRQRASLIKFWENESPDFEIDEEGLD